MAGKAEHELDDAVVEQGHPDLERVRHAHSVHFREDVVGQVHLGIRVQKPVERVVMADLVVVPTEKREGVEAALEPGEDGIAQEVPLEAVVEEGLPRVVAACRLLEGVGHEATRLEVEADLALGHRQTARERGKDSARERRRKSLVESRELVGLVGDVPGEELVAPVPAQRDRHVAPRELRKVVGGDGRGVGERLIEVVHELRDQVGDIRGDGELGVVRLERSGDAPRIRPLVVGRVVEADREGLQGAAMDLASQGDDGARIEPAAQECPQGNVRDQLPPDGIREEREELGPHCRGTDGAVAGLNLREVPVSAIDQPAVLPDQEVTGFELPDLAVNGVGGWDVEQRQVEAERLDIDRRSKAVGEQRLHFRPEEKSILERRVVERFDPQSIPRQNESAPTRIPESDRKHAVEVADEVEPVIFVQVDEDLGIGACVKVVAACFQLAPEFGDVIDLAVVNRPHGPIFVVDGLLAGVEIDNREAPHGEADVTLEIDAVVVRTPVDEGRTHGGDRRGLHGPLALAIDLTDDAAHGSGRCAVGPAVPDYFGAIRSSREAG